ncbi:MAG TPA: ABC transporter permease [Desulfobacterales bacterium]|nr:ABC transporter permease [Desulfobacterales bacterium]
MIWETLILALRAIRRNIMRSSLTVLGIVIGVAAVITMVTLGGGATAQVKAEISSLGSNMLQMRPGQHMRGPGGTRSQADMFEMEDADAIIREISGLEAVAPAVSTSMQVISGNKNWSTSVMGSTGAFLQVRDWELESGRLFTGAETLSGKAVCILGKTVRNELFGDTDPLGMTLRLKKLSCQIVGVFESKGQSNFGSDQDDFVLIPLRTFQRRIAGNNDINTIYLSAQDGISTTEVKESIERLMRERRHITAGEDDDFHVMDMQEIVGTLTGTTRILTALLGAVAAVSLLVGGIGIMNIMLVSVTERTREIGTRLAIGALEREVLMQFLIEAVVLSSFGGLFGIMVGLFASSIGAYILGVPFILNSEIIVIAFVFSAAVGVVFGFFPAKKAARMDPIEALRHE